MPVHNVKGIHLGWWLALPSNWMIPSTAEDRIADHIVWWTTSGQCFKHVFVRISDNQKLRQSEIRTIIQQAPKAMFHLECYFVTTPITFNWKIPILWKKQHTISTIYLLEAFRQSEIPTKKHWPQVRKSKVTISKSVLLMGLFYLSFVPRRFFFRVRPSSASQVSVALSWVLSCGNVWRTLSWEIVADLSHRIIASNIYWKSLKLLILNYKL